MLAHVITLSRMVSCAGLGFSLLLPIHAEQVVISKILAAPSPDKPEYLELYNNTSNPFDIARWRLTTGVSFTFPDFSSNQPAASFLKPFERIVLSSADPSQTRAAYATPASVRIFGPWDGKLKDDSERITLQDKNGATVCSVKYGRGLAGTRPVAGYPWVLIDPNREIDDWRNWSVSSQVDGAPGTAPVRTVESAVSSPEVDAGLGRVLVNFDATWRYLDSGQNPEPRWPQPAFNDTRWRPAAGLIGFDQKPLPKPGLRTRVTMGGQITYYFRGRFTFTGGHQSGDRLLLDQILDDGAVYYLNGKEVARSRMPVGRPTASTLASSTVPTAAEERSAFALDPDWLIPGTNVLAVEVHQSNTGSSDIVFGMRLRLMPAVPPGLVINELFIGPRESFVEFHNHAATPLNLKGCFLSDDAENLSKHLFSSDLIVPAGGLVSVSLAECQIKPGNPLALYLTAPDGQTVLSAISASFAEDGRSLGRRPDGGDKWFRFPEPTRSRPNPVLEAANPGPQREVAALDTPVVINEILSDPPYGHEGVEFVELFNRGTSVVDLSGWRFTDGIRLVFDPGTLLSPGGYGVVVGDLKRFQAAYAGVPVLGIYEAKLRHRGELVRLLDAASNLVDQVDFRLGGDWPSLPHGRGSSLELIHPWMENNSSSAWAASHEADKGEWQTYSCTNTYLELNPTGQPSDYRELQLYLVGEGHVALRQFGLWRNGANLLDNPGRMSGDGSSASGWLAQGTHWTSFVSNAELHVVSDGRGDNKANRVEIDCARLRPGQSYELRFQARWISGCPRLIVHTWDRSLGGSFLLSIPAALGTPGRANSVSGQPLLGPAQAAPQVDHLLHTPAVPRSSDAVRVTASVVSTAPLASVRLFHRLDNLNGDGPWAQKPMSLAGPVAGTVNGSGMYLAELTEYPTDEVVVQFYVEAVATNGQTNRLPRLGAAQPALFVVDDRKIPRDSRIDRFVVSAYDLGSMREGQTAKYGFHHPRQSNHRYNMTFISNEESVFYGGAIRVSGSPFTRGRDLGKGKWELPGDRPFRGRTKFYFDNDSNLHNRLCRYLLYQLGHPTSEAEWVRVIINSSGAYLREDTEPVSGEFVDRLFPAGRQGELYRFDDEWWFADGGERNNRDADWSYKGTDDPLPYRCAWQKRTREVEDDYSALVSFFQAVSSPQASQEDIERILDPVAVLQMAAVRGYIGDWDSFTMFRGKNGYFYRRPADGKFQFFQWDSDLAFRAGNYPFYSDRVAPWLERPENLEPFRAYLQQLAQFSQSPRLAEWFREEMEATPARTVNARFYQTFFRQRNQLLLPR